MQCHRPITRLAKERNAAKDLMDAFAGNPDMVVLGQKRFNLQQGQLFSGSKGTCHESNISLRLPPPFKCRRHLSEIQITVFLPIFLANESNKPRFCEKKYIGHLMTWKPPKNKGPMVRNCDFCKRVIRSNCPGSM